MSPSGPITDALQTYIRELVKLPVDQPLDIAFQKALEAEREMRHLFGSDPTNPLLQDLHLGLVDIFDLHPAARRTRTRSVEPLKKNIYEHYIFPLPRTQRRANLAPSTVFNIEAFQEHWKIFTHEALSHMRAEDWNNVVVAGGSVLACLMAPLPHIASLTDLNKCFLSNLYADSDIDIFLWGLRSEEAEKKMLDISQAVCKAAPWPVTCVRKANTISIHTQWPRRPIQIILRLYQSPAEILAGFDVDSACCTRVWVNARALTALIRQSNTIDMSRRSPSYEFRLLKYAKRGFEIYAPLLCRDKVKLSLYARNLMALPEGLARLLVFEAAYHDEHFYHYLGNWLKIRQGTLPYVADEKDVDFDMPFSDNNYDSKLCWAKIPYGRLWTAEKIERMVQSKDAWVNSPQNKNNLESTNYHRHVAFAGTMQQCLAYFCQVCGIIEDLGFPPSFNCSPSYIHGRVKFMTKNPGQQVLTGSFQPREPGKWAYEAYHDLAAPITVPNQESVNRMRRNKQVLLSRLLDLA